MNRGRKRNAPGSPAEWLDSARSGLRPAQEDSRVRPEQTCFHARQAAEKAIKALLILRRIELPSA
jgi:HEPN domain-containing protein